MEAYMAAEAGQYLMMNLQRQSAQLEEAKYRRTQQAHSQGYKLSQKRGVEDKSRRADQGLSEPAPPLFMLPRSHLAAARCFTRWQPRPLEGTVPTWIAPG